MIYEAVLFISSLKGIYHQIEILYFLLSIQFKSGIPVLNQTICQIQRFVND